MLGLLYKDMFYTEALVTSFRGDLCCTIVLDCIVWQELANTVLHTGAFLGVQSSFPRSHLRWAGRGCV